MGRKARVLAAAALIAATTQAWAVEPLVIDNFSAGPGFGVVLTPAFPNDTVVTNDTGLPAGSVLGGTRWHRFQSCLSSGAMLVSHNPSAGVYQAGGGPDATFCEGPGFEYDGDGEGLAANVSAYNALRIDLTQVDAGDPNNSRRPGELPTVSINLDSARATREFAASDGHTAVVVPFASFRDRRGGAVSSFDDVSGVSLYFGRLGEGAAIGIDEFAFVSLAALDGDFNGDGAVTDADYALFRVAYGVRVEPGTVADGNGDGLIDAADYTVWRDARAAAPAAPAPEPTAGWLAALACAIRPRRRFA